MSSFEYRPGPFDWRHLDQQGASELWVSLRSWVEWLRWRYELGNDIRPCWFKHDALVEELTAAMAAHSEVYQQLKAHFHGGMSAWHYQVLWPLVGRLGTVADFEQCRGGRCGHQPSTPDLADDFAEFIAAEVTGRSEFAPVAEPETGSATALTMDQVIEMIDGGTASPEDPSDDFTAVDIDGTCWEFDDDTETYRPVE